MKVKLKLLEIKSFFLKLRMNAVNNWAHWKLYTNCLVDRLTDIVGPKTFVEEYR